MATRKKQARATKGGLERENGGKEGVAKAKQKQQKVAIKPDEERNMKKKGKQKKGTRTAKKLFIGRTRRERSPIETILIMMVN